MKVLRIELSRDRMLSMPELDHTFFLALGHVANEINATTKLMYWAAQARSDNEADQHGNFALTFFLTRVLAGHLNEAWEFLQKSFFKSSLSRDYVPRLNAECGDNLEHLKHYFSSTNSCNLIRNSFAFHFSAADIAGTLPNVDDQLLIYLERASAPNNLFYCSEVVLAHALLELLRKQSQKSDFDGLVEELFDIATRFIQVADCLMEAIIAKSGIEMRPSNPEMIHFKKIKQFGEISIPWFTDTSDAVEKTKGSA